MEAYYWVIHQIYWSLPGKYHFIRAIPNPALYLLYIYFVITPHLFLLDYLCAKVRSKLCPVKKTKLPNKAEEKTDAKARKEERKIIKDQEDFVRMYHLA